MNQPAHKIFIDKYLDWRKVCERLHRYKHIHHQYPIKSLKQCSNNPPYYCHYLAWRLGTWKNENFFKFLDNLLEIGASLKNWESNINLLRSCRFDDFWGLLWQLQIAKFFSIKKDCQVEWMRSGPDLKVTLGNKELFIECYTYRKSFAVKEFIADLYNSINKRIKVNHIPCTQFSLPNDSKRLENLLDELFKPCLDSGFLEKKFKEAQIEYPILLPIPNDINNFYIYIEGDTPENYIPGIIPNAAGDAEVYLNHAIKEALNNKRYKNKISQHRPNLLAINFLLDRDYQKGIMRQKELRLSIPHLDFGNTFDMVLLAICGIDKNLSMDNCHLGVRPGFNHPVIKLFRT